MLVSATHSRVSAESKTSGNVVGKSGRLAVPSHVVRVVAWSVCPNI